LADFLSSPQAEYASRWRLRKESADRDICGAENINDFIYSGRAILTLAVSKTEQPCDIAAIMINARIVDGNRIADRGSRCPVEKEFAMADKPASRNTAAALALLFTPQV
jgi:hypothetical protein